MKGGEFVAYSLSAEPAPPPNSGIKRLPPTRFRHFYRYDMVDFTDKIGRFIDFVFSIADICILLPHSTLKSAQRLHGYNRNTTSTKQKRKE